MRPFTSDATVLFALGNCYPAGIGLRHGKLILERFHGGHFAITANPQPAKTVILWATKLFRESPSHRLFAMAFAVQAIREWHAGPLFLAHAYCDYSRANQPSCLCGYAQLIQSLPVDCHFFFDLHRTDYLSHWHCPIIHRTSIQLWAEYFIRHSPAIDLVVSPDLGRGKAAGELASALGLDHLILDKTANYPPKQTLRGQVFGRRILLYDDEIVSGKTMRRAISLLIGEGATAIFPAITYALCGASTLRELGDIPSVGLPIVSDLIQRSRLPCAILPMANALLPACLKMASTCHMLNENVAKMIA
jgi:phosphoribosylpyrophosphate synthetase